VETINGYVVIADRPHQVRCQERVILAVKSVMTAVRAGGFEYVVATTAPREDAPREWHHGDYTMSLDDAVRRFHER